MSALWKRQHEPPTILLGTDLHQTIGWPGEKTALFTSLNMDRKALLSDFRPRHDSRQSVQVQQMDYLRGSMTDGRIPAITVGDMQRFGTNLEFYPHVEQAFRRYKDIAESEGARLVIAVVTNAWQPIVEASSLVRSGVVDVVYGQRFINRTIHGVNVAFPQGSLNEASKPAAINDLRRKFRVDGVHTIFMGNGEGDVAALRNVARFNGRAVIITSADELHPPHDSATGRRYQDETSIKHMAEDAIVATNMYEEGILSAVLPANYSEGSYTDRCLSDYVRYLARDVSRSSVQQVERSGFGSRPVAEPSSPHLTALA